MTKSLHHSATHQEHPGKPRRKLVATLQFLAVTLIPVALVVALQRISIEQPLKAGEPAPNFTLKTLSGDTVSLASLYHERAAIFFFSADCPHCKKDLMNIEQLREVFGGRVQFLLVTRSDPAKTIALLDSLGVSTATAIDEGGRAQTAFGAFTVPAIFLINPGGIIHAGLFGERSLDVRREQLESLLEATADSVVALVRPSR